MNGLRFRTTHPALLAIASALALAAPAAATVDMTGDWLVTYSFGTLPGTGRFTFSQTGTALSVAAPPFSGSIDPDSGVFTLSGSTYCDSLPETLSGTVAGDGQSFTGTYTVYFPDPMHPRCVGLSSLATGVRAGDCGNGVLEPGEECDVGPAGDGCCSADCHATAAGVPCDPASTACGLDMCDGAGSCVQDSDTDGDGLGDRCDPCTNGGTITAASVAIGDFGGPRRDRFVVRGTLTLPGAPLVDPTRTGLSIRIVGADGTLFRGAGLGGYWTTRGARRWTFHVPSPQPGVVDRASLVASASTPGVLRFSVRATHAIIDDAPPRLPLSVIVSLDPAGVCGEGYFPGPPGVAPSCVATATGQVVCK